MKISSQTLSNYGYAVDTIAAKAKDYVISIIRYGIEVEGLSSVSAIRDYAILGLEQTLGVFGDQAAAYSANVYDALMSEYALDLEPGKSYGMDYNKEQLTSSVRYHAKKLVNGDLNGFLQNVGQKAFDLTRNTANQTMIKNAKRDYKKGVRWARVPSGLETCGFCVMLASRGFVYHTKESAGYNVLGLNRFHSFCDCRVFPGTEDTEIEGYDPEHLYDVYLNARKTIYNDTRRKWESAISSNQTIDSFSQWLTKATVKEIETRSLQWVYKNEPGKITKDKGANPLTKERKIANTLSKNGFDVHFKKTIVDKKTADLLINSNTWEIKQPVGDRKNKTIGKNTIDHQFEEASKQSRRLVLDMTVVNSYNLGESPKNQAVALFFGKWSKAFDEMLLISESSIERYKK
ncbi:putative uncharacterized protein [Eggerthella sp. CAG:368]|nr:putative uncharacterized protein [Eggerthella sp. CAG:368]